jgi:peptidoglycan-associated lipoprotein
VTVSAGNQRLESKGSQTASEVSFMSSTHRVSIALVGLSLFLFAAGCKKKVPVAPPPPPPQAEAKEVPPPRPEPPKITLFSLEPSAIQRGQSTQLRWSVEHASSVSIEPGVGMVSSDGSRRVSPSDSVTYKLHASGPGGAADATATINVTAPPPPPPARVAPAKTLGERVTADVADAYFDYDKFDIREDARTVLTRDAGALKAILQDFPNASIAVEGHCDERGSAEYNLGLGDRRATAVRDYLVQLGVPADRLRTVSYGKEHPQCTESSEACWQKNRRAHFAAESAGSAPSQIP